jgi:hypothetical protein
MCLPTNATMRSNMSPVFDKSGEWPVALGVDIFQRDLASRLAVVGNEALRLVAREIRVDILVVVQHVAAALEPDRGRCQHLLAALEREHRVALGHVGLAAPIVVLPRDDGFRPFRRIGAGERALGEPVAAERIDHWPRHHHPANSRIVRGGARRQRDRGVARIVWPHGDEHRQMPAARLAREPHEVSLRLERAGIELRPAHRIVDVLHRGRIGSLVARTEIERDRHDAVRRHGLVAQPLRGPVAQAPGAAVALDQRREWPLAARPEHAGEQRLVAMAEVLDVLHIEFMCLGVEDFGIQDCSCHGQAPVREIERRRSSPMAPPTTTRPRSCVLHPRPLRNVPFRSHIR